MKANIIISLLFLLLSSVCEDEKTTLLQNSEGT